MELKIKRCPFCNGEVRIGVSDDEGNNRDEDYENDPWSGLSFVLVHDNDENDDCPIAHHPGEILGSRLYDSRKEATHAWNKRN